MVIALQIGGSVVRLHEPKDYPHLAWPLRPFDLFAAPAGIDPDIQVDISLACPLPEIETGPLRFDSGHGLWKLFESASGLVAESLDTSTLQPRARALISEDYRTVRAWILPDLQDGQVGWCPMYVFNPIIEICVLSRLAREGAILLHASGLTFQEQGFVFTGPSGAGKSTIAQLFADRGAFVLSDERVIIRRSPTTRVYGTPWVGSGNYAANDSAPLTALYCISHGEERHRLSLLSPSNTLSLLLQQAFLPHWDRAAMDATLDSLLSLMKEVPCSGLAFLKQTDVIDVIRHQSPACSIAVL
ncbi:MAG: hypothetical protein OJF47_001170 [Nitrospira sp.]|jgi:hypothetical protein|nr:MAG: hypothetical protein OJF47_001170 [Nitrospira sp.]